MKKHRKKKENKSREEGENGRDVAKEGMRARKVARERWKEGEVVLSRKRVDEYRQNRSAALRSSWLVVYVTYPALTDA